MGQFYRASDGNTYTLDDDETPDELEYGIALQQAARRIVAQYAPAPVDPDARVMGGHESEGSW